MVRLENRNGITKRCPTGFSWTTLFFGPFVPLFRGWLPMVPIYLGGSLLTFGIFGLVMPFQINRYWLSYLLDIGYEPATPADAKAIEAMGLPDARLPRWAKSAVKTYLAGQLAPYGLYVALNAFDYRFVGEDNSPLDGLKKTEYMHLPILLTLALVPFLGLFFYFAFPVIVIGFVLFGLFKLVFAPLRSLVLQKAHLVDLRWDPVMAHMKRPENENKPTEQQEKNQDAKNQKNS